MRPTAYKLKIEDIVHGEYKRSMDGAEPSLLLTPWNDEVTRVRVMGTIVDKFIRDDKSYATLRLDDGSGTIRLRAWGKDVPRLDCFKVGDIIDVIGRVREFEGEIYVATELLVPVEDPNWELVRELEIIQSRKSALAHGVKPKLPPKLEPRTLQVDLKDAGVEESFGEQELLPEVPEELPPLPQVSEEVKGQVLAAVRENVSEEGISAAEVAANVGLSMAEVEDAIKVLLVGGDIFEPKAGKFREVT